MKDSRKTDIEDIDRHQYNFKIFCMFLKQEKKYQLFKKLIFTNNNRTPNDLFKDINAANVCDISLKLDSRYCDTDRKWGGVFSYSPICKFSWGYHPQTINYTCMVQMIKRWHEFLMENNFDKQL